jgi:murein DD-endopeptidase MepM/ murein hydrolase activator NlpD
VDIQDLINANRLSDPSKIDKGQKLLIPNASRKIDVSDEAVPYQKQSRKGYVWPVKGRVISYYGSVVGSVKNKGIDIEAEAGRPIVAARAGKVVFCDDKVKGLGKTIIIEHSNGYSTLYGHNSENLVSVGEYVKQNQPIARVGTTGRTKKPALHFEIRKGHEPKNPYYYLR